MSDALVDAHDVVFFDLDGVVYLGPGAVAGAPETIRALRERGVRVIFVTNNAARKAETVAAHLTALGFPATADDLVTSSQAAAALLARELPPGSKVLVAGTQDLVDLIAAAGFHVVRAADEQPAAVVQGYDPLISWSLLEEAAIAVQRGARWFATNTDSTRPTERGLVPGAGAAVAVVRSTVAFDPTVVGKPHRPLMEEALRRTGAARPLFVGDRIDTDIAGACSVGMASILVFTGAHGKRDLVIAVEGERPTLIGWDLPALLEPARTATVVAAEVRCGAAVAREVNGVATVTGDLTTRAGQLDALWALTQVAWAGAEVDDVTLDLLNLIP